jgi:hypothetical protein
MGTGSQEQVPVFLFPHGNLSQTYHLPETLLLSFAFAEVTMDPVRSAEHANNTDKFKKADATVKRLYLELGIGALQPAYSPPTPGRLIAPVPSSWGASRRVRVAAQEDRDTFHKAIVAAKEDGMWDLVVRTTSAVRHAHTPDLPSPAPLLHPPRYRRTPT